MEQKIKSHKRRLRNGKTITVRAYSRKKRLPTFEELYGVPDPMDSYGAEYLAEKAEFNRAERAKRSKMERLSKSLSERYKKSSKGKQGGCK